MFEKVKSKFYEIISVFQKNNFDTKLIKKAYDFANKAHGGQLRKDGKPYIIHPVEVAYILADLGFDEDVVSAALLHDVVEDCGYTVSQIAELFNPEVAKLVDCVSAIDQAKYIFNKEDIFEDPSFPKASREEQSFKKLIAIGKENPKGFCIKFADRLNNLSTIGCFDHNKQLEKVKETEKWILPIAKRLNAKYFYESIKNECFKIVYRGKCDHFLEQYSSYHNSNKHNVENILEMLNGLFLNKVVRAIKFNDIKEYKIYENLSKRSKTINISQISQGQILKAPNYDIYLLYNEEKFGDILRRVINSLNKKLSNFLKIIDIKTDSLTQLTYLVVEDEFKNKYNLHILSLEEYATEQTGVLTKQLADIMDDDELDELDVELIKVKTRSGEVKYIQEGSTVLDFAFKIHKDIGFGFKYAVVNGSKTKIPPYTKLMENDTIEIITEKDECGNIINFASLKWFAYVNTDLAKKALIKYFEQNLKAN